MHESTTIAALATAPLPSGLAVVRVSGALSRLALSAIFESKHDPIATPRRLEYGHLIDYRTKAVIDHALAVYMPGPHSYTGEDVAEFQFHGAPLLVEKVLRSLFAFGVSPAEPGEFTKRSFLNGKIDLVQAEAISDLIAASSDSALKIASEQLRGRFSSAVDRIGEPLKNCLAELEAATDFPEEDIEPKKLIEVGVAIADAKSQIAHLIGTYSYGSTVKEGFRVLLCGRPNVGKSSLLNRLLGRERAIVSDIAGTTRDLIEEQANLGGYTFVFCDSAGITESTDTVERIGIELARERIGWADLVLLVVDAGDTSGDWQAVVAELKGKAKKIWFVVNKIDLYPQVIGTMICDSNTCARNFYITALRPDGADSLVQALVSEVKQSLPDSAEASEVVTNARHQGCLFAAAESLQRAIEGCNAGDPPEIISAELRCALGSLGEIVGKTYTEDILGRIFSQFCVGK